MNLVPLEKLFDVTYGNKLDFKNMTVKIDRSVAFVSRISKNNGVVGYVDMITTPPYPAGYITVNLGGAILESNIQILPFYTAQNIAVLKPKRQMNELEKVFYCLVIKANKFRYGAFGREANRTIKTLLVPDTVPKKFLEIKISLPSKGRLSERKMSIEKSKFKDFKLSDLFTTIERGKCGSAEKLLEKGNDISYVGAKKEENGFMYTVVRDEKYVTRGNCIVFIGDGQGSVGYSTYQENDFIGSTTLSMGRNSHLNKYNALFVITLLDKERFKYSFGRKWNGEKLKNTKIKLPTNNEGVPDWPFMENYIKSLPYSASL